MIIEDERNDKENEKVDFYTTLPPQSKKGDFENFISKSLDIRDKQEHLKLKNDLIEHLWKLNGEGLLTKK